MPIAVPPYKVYIIGCEASKALKIGIAKNVERRLNALQTGSPGMLCVHWEFTRLTKDEARRVEKGAHKALKAHKVRGEWFDVAPDEAIAAVWDQLDKKVYTARQLATFDLRGHVPVDEWQAMVQVARGDVINAQTV